MWKSFLLYVCCLLETLDIHHGMKKSVVVQVGTVADACLMSVCRNGMSGSSFGGLVCRRYYERGSTRNYNSSYIPW